MDAVTLMIKAFFDKDDADYELIENSEEGVDIFKVGFLMDHEDICVKISVVKEKQMYTIRGASNFNSVPQRNINGALRAINEANQVLPQGCLYLDTETGLIIFSSGTHTDGLTFSEETFLGSLNVCIHALDNLTGKIIRDAAIYQPLMETSSSRSLWSRLFPRK
ncbi:MAG: YbjN domain-containing protein [Muribaculaceae bacterium]|nr:YbjN domain-containing protein [Muribaculaceae bacterium]